MKKLKILYLTGFMASGKSTVGPKVATALGWDFIDLDKYIEQKTGRRIPDIFETDGEAAFREIESQTLREFGSCEGTVIALGGGAVISSLNLDYIKAVGILIYLKLPADVIYNRIKRKTTRPLFNDLIINNRPESEFIARITSLLEKRKEYYEKADIIVELENYPINVSVDLVLEKIMRYCNEKNYC